MIYKQEHSHAGYLLGGGGGLLGGGGGLLGGGGWAFEVGRRSKHVLNYTFEGMTRGPLTCYMPRTPSYTKVMQSSSPFQ